eukprot:m.59030 g.59030  ORF g.59030 m.59030 type:complete len:497 (-) comp22644_c0_seq2:43-1533(-)
MGARETQATETHGLTRYVDDQSAVHGDTDTRRDCGCVGADADVNVRDCTAFKFTMLGALLGTVLFALTRNTVPFSNTDTRDIRYNNNNNLGPTRLAIKTTQQANVEQQQHHHDVRNTGDVEINASLTTEPQEVLHYQPEAGTLGFYIHVYDQPAAVIHITQEIKRLYKDAPIYIMSDGGLGFNGLCAEIGNCTFKMCPAANDRWHPWPFLHRIRQAAIALNTEYFIMVEPDNQIHGVIKHPMLFDAGGYDDPYDGFSPYLVNYVNDYVRDKFNRPEFNWSYPKAGLAGGTYFRSAAVIDAFADEAVANINWTHVMSLDTARVMSSDYAMPIALAMAGYTYGPWNDSVYISMHNVTEDRGGKQRLRDGFAFSHQRKYKEEYTRNITTWEQQKLFEETPSLIVRPKVYELEDKAHEGKFVKTRFKNRPPQKWTPPNPRFTSKMGCVLCWDVREYQRAYNTTECANPIPVQVYGKLKKIWATHLHLRKTIDPNDTLSHN